MSNKLLEKIGNPAAIFIGVAGIIISILLVGAFISALIIPSIKIDLARNRVAKAYSSLGLPAGLQLSQKTSFGDPIDAPDDAGWRYEYRTAEDFQSISQKFKEKFAIQGFSIQKTEDADAPRFEGDPDKSADFVAVNKSRNLRLLVMFLPAFVSVNAEEF